MYPLAGFCPDLKEVSAMPVCMTHHLLVTPRNCAVYCLQELLCKARSGGLRRRFWVDRWVDSHTWELARIQTMSKHLEDESLPDAEVIRIPEQYDPSPVRRALMDLNLVEAPSSVPSLSTTVPAIESLKDV